MIFVNIWAGLAYTIGMISLGILLGFLVFLWILGGRLK